MNPLSGPYGCYAAMPVIAANYIASGIGSSERVPSRYAQYTPRRGGGPGDEFCGLVAEENSSESREQYRGASDMLKDSSILKRIYLRGIMIASIFKDPAYAVVPTASYLVPSSASKPWTNLQINTRGRGIKKQEN